MYTTVAEIGVSKNYYYFQIKRLVHPQFMKILSFTFYESLKKNYIFREKYG